MSNWHYTKDGQAAGPVSFDTLRQMAASGELPEGTMVWTEGMPDWVPPTEIPGLTGQDTVKTTEAGSTTPDSENPYAAPAAASNLAASPSSSDLEDITPGSEPLRIGALFSKSWDIFKRNVGIIFGFGIIYVVISIATQYAVSTIFPGSGETIDIGMGDEFALQQDESIPAQIINSIISLFLGLGAIRFGLNLFRGHDASISDLFSQGHLLIRSILAQIMAYLIIAAAVIPGAALIFISARGGDPNTAILILGIIIAFIPAAFLGTKLYFAQYSLVDRDTSAVDCLKDSWALTTNNVLRLILFMIVQGLIVLGGLLALIIGLALALPIVFLSSIAAYLFLRHGWRATIVD